MYIFSLLILSLEQISNLFLCIFLLLRWYSVSITGNKSQYFSHTRGYLEFCFILFVHPVILTSMPRVEGKNLMSQYKKSNAQSLLRVEGELCPTWTETASVFWKIFTMTWWTKVDSIQSYWNKAHFGVSAQLKHTCLWTVGWNQRKHVNPTQKGPRSNQETCPVSLVLGRMISVALRHW